MRPRKPPFRSVSDVAKIVQAFKNNSDDEDSTAKSTAIKIEDEQKIASKKPPMS